jgi:hypothetical protein
MNVKHSTGTPYLALGSRIIEDNSAAPEIPSSYGTQNFVSVNICRPQHLTCTEPDELNPHDTPGFLNIIFHP